MPFIPHSEKDVAEMLRAIGAKDIEALFDEIPEALRSDEYPGIPDGTHELDLGRLMQKRARQDETVLNFIGAGAYEHHIPAAVWSLASRGEFLTAYTPYQAEASQGTLQVIYEFQTMMSRLTGMDCSNASLYDGASAFAEAVLMAVRCQKRGVDKRDIVVLGGLHPAYRETAETICSMQGIRFVEVPFCPKLGCSLVDSLETVDVGQAAALVIQQPNFFGVLEDVHGLVDWAQAHEIMTIGVVNPISLALLESPALWGQGEGVDIVCGEGQPLGIPLAGGGPYLGFLCCKKPWIRQLPGRIVGRTLDQQGKPGFTLTLQAREQHIRRAKATSNICTNQGLLLTVATIYLSLLGSDGLKNVALASHQNTCRLLECMEAIGLKRRFQGEFFHEVVIDLPARLKTEDLLADLAGQHIAGGYPLGRDFEALSSSLLLCATETKTVEDIEQFGRVIEAALQAVEVG